MFRSCAAMTILAIGAQVERCEMGRASANLKKMFSDCLEIFVVETEQV